MSSIITITIWKCDPLGILKWTSTNDSRYLRPKILGFYFSILVPHRRHPSLVKSNKSKIFSDMLRRGRGMIYLKFGLSLANLLASFQIRDDLLYFHNMCQVWVITLQFFWLISMLSSQGDENWHNSHLIFYDKNGW